VISTSKTMLKEYTKPSRRRRRRRRRRSDTPSE
jgi:hypothetical protein